MSAVVVQPEVQMQSEATALIRVIERAASNPDVDIDKMERLLQMQERIMDRNAKAAYTAALSAMQPDLPVINENGEILNKAGGVQSTYALWEDINDAIKPLLAQHGFALSFRTGAEPNGVKVKAVLSHRDGHSEETEIYLPADNSGNKNSVQAFGSSTSYAKRYTAIALLNITSRGEDDDGKAGGDAADEAADMVQVNKFVSRFTDALDADVEDPAKAGLVYAIHQDLRGKQEIYMAVGKLLGSKKKNQIHAYVQMFKKERDEVKYDTRGR